VADFGVVILVVTAPPSVRHSLWPTGGRILPVLLTAERGEVKERPNASERLNAAVGRKVGAINRVAILEKDAEAERLAFVGCDTEVHVEVAFGRGDPWDAPSHPLPVLLDIRQRRAGHQAKGGIPRVQMGKVADLIDKH